MSPRGAGPPCPPPRRAAFISTSPWLGGGGGCAAGGRVGRRAPGLAPSLPGPATGGWWAVGTQGASPYLPALQPTPALAGAHTVGCAQKGRQSVFRDSPLGPPERRGHTHSTHARTQMPARPHPIRLQSHGHMYIRAHPLAHSAWMDILRQEVWVTPTCTHANVA